jgi:hypothetical protein
MTTEEAQQKDFVFAPMKGRFGGGRTPGLGRVLPAASGGSRPIAVIRHLYPNR